MIFEHLPILKEYMKNFHVETFEKIGSNIKIRIQVHFKDHSVLFIKEIYIQNKRKYAYHWQDMKGELLFRWDNAPDWPDIKTYPHHKHNGDKVEPSYEIDAKSIFQAIVNTYSQKNK